MYVERLECYFMANDMDNRAKWHAILLSCCVPYLLGTGAESNTLNSNIRRYVSQFKFKFCSQQPGESVVGYMAELCKSTVAS